MIGITGLKADLKQIAREPILVLFAFIPIFIFVMFKLMITFLFPFILAYTGFNVVDYSAYLLAFTLLMAPSMLGTVVGFLMLDDRDEKIYQLMSVTPIGYMGYIMNRLLIPFLGSVLYTFMGYFILNIRSLSFPILIYLSILTGIQGITIGLLLFNLAGDKVQGLTYSKALSALGLFSLADLLDMKWLSVIAGFVPFYWIYKLISSPEISFVVISALVHVFWLVVIAAKSGRSF